MPSVSFGCRGLAAAAFCFVANATSAQTCAGLDDWQPQAGAGSTRWTRAGGEPAFRIADAGDEVFDAAVVSPSLALPPSGLRLAWRQHAQLSWANTAGVLEVAVDGGAWTDFTAAGGRFLAGGYDSRAFAGNPLGARPAWGGEDRAFETRAELPGGNGARTVRLRFRLGSSGTGDARPGWRIEGFACR